MSRVMLNAADATLLADERWSAPATRSLKTRPSNTARIGPRRGGFAMRTRFCTGVRSMAIGVVILLLGAAVRCSCAAAGGSAARRIRASRGTNGRFTR